MLYFLSNNNCTFPSTIGAINVFPSVILALECRREGYSDHSNLISSLPVLTIFALFFIKNIKDQTVKASSKYLHEWNFQIEIKRVFKSYF